MATRGSQACWLLLSSLIGASTAEAAPIKVCVSSYQSEGLDAASSLAFRDKLVLELQALGATVAPLPPGRAGGGFEDRVCAERARDELGAQGVLKVRLFRLGPTVRIKLNAFDTSGAPSGRAVSSAPSRGFPDSAKISGDVEALLLKLGHSLAPAEPPPPSVAEPVSTGDPPADERDHGVDVPPTDSSVTDAAGAQDPGPGLGAILSYGGIGLGGLLLLSGAVTGGLALATSRELAAVCDGQICPDDRADDIATMNTLASITNGLLAAGGVVAVVSVISLLLIGGDDATEGERP